MKRETPDMRPKDWTFAGNRKCLRFMGPGNYLEKRV